MILWILAQGAGAQSDEVVGFREVNYTRPWYSGLLKVGGDKLFHYVFFPSQSQKKDDPVLLWLNGGPGCSSMIGMLHEHGPFVFKRNTTELVLNNNSWNMNAHVLYIESPGSVGFSVGPVESTDESVAEDNFQALNSFFAKYPDYGSNQLYLSGQSYAGIYIPTLAYRIHRAKLTQNSALNLKGFIVGNACTDPSQCYLPDSTNTEFSTAQVTYLYRHGFLTDSEWSNFRNICILGYGSEACRNTVNAIAANFDKLNVSINNIYHKCEYQVIGHARGFSGRRLKQGQDGSYMSCDDQIGAYTWLNKPEVKNMLHVSSGIKWSPCSDEVEARYKQNEDASLWVYRQLVGKYRIWVYSGDFDANVPITGTKRWLHLLQEELDLPEVRPWREWWVPGKHAGEDQIGGDTWELQGLTFASVKGAGHLVPSNKPFPSLVMVESFLRGSPLPFR